MPVPNVSAKILSKVIEYCKYHVEATKKNSDDKPAKPEEEIKTWDTDFVKVDQATLFELILVRAWPYYAMRAPCPACCMRVVHPDLYGAPVHRRPTT